MTSLEAPVEIVRLALEHRLDREAYTLGKRAFINRITEMALKVDYS